jgi:signal transduction histidine kinase
LGLHARDIFKGATAVRVPGASSNESNIQELADLEGPAVLVKAVELVIKNGTTIRRLETDYATPSAEKRVLGITISPVRGAGGEPLGAAGLVSDLTAITKMSQQIQMQENMAALGEMSAGIAHEFKNSLATISGYAQMLSSDDAASPDEQFAGKIASETAALSRIVNDFLNFARPQGLAQEVVDLGAILQDCAQEAHVTLEGVPAAEPLTILGDPTALRQALSNLLRNSAEAVTEGTKAVVRLDTALETDSLRISLCDNGSGIPAEDLPRIFIPFFTTKSTGTGLGLALVHRIVTEQSGSIQVQSSPAGTTFTLTFPRFKNANVAAISR